MKIASLAEVKTRFSSYVKATDFRDVVTLLNSREDKVGYAIEEVAIFSLIENENEIE